MYRVGHWTQRNKRRMKLRRPVEKQNVVVCSGVTVTHY